MTDTKALDALIEAVEAGNNFGIIPKAQAVLAEFDPNYGVGETVCSAFDGSLDAAKALHEALLPWWALQELSMWPGINGQCTATLWGTHIKDGELWHHHSDGRQDAASSTPARAWLLAILKAYRASL